MTRHLKFPFLSCVGCRVLERPCVLSELLIMPPCCRESTDLVIKVWKDLNLDNTCYKKL